MCNFFSFITRGAGDIYYLDWKERQALLKSNPYEYDPDSHTSIAAICRMDEDQCNKYEYNPLTDVFKVDQINTTDDREGAAKSVRSLDFKSVVEPLVVKNIIHPFRDVTPPPITQKHLDLLRQWDSVWASVRDSVWDSVRYSVWASVWDSVWYSVWAYVGSFFRLRKWQRIGHKPGVYPFQPAVDLWEMGLVPSFDGKMWRLHGGEDAKILWEGKLKQ